MYLRHSLTEPEVVDRIEDFLAEGATKTALRISRILLIMLFTAHFMACAWILASRMNGDLHPEEASWISTDEVKPPLLDGCVFVSALSRS